MYRYETPTRGHSLDDGLAARIYDPLWMLARQWQFGEFQHENAASPAWVDMAVEVHLLDRWGTGSGGAQHPFDPAVVPLEKLVEEHEGGPTPQLRLAGGLRWRRALLSAGVGTDVVTFTTLCPFPDGPLVDRADVLIRAVVSDGAVLADCLERLTHPATRDAEMQALLAVGTVITSIDDLIAMATSWLTWWRDAAPDPISPEDDCWDPHRCEHAFTLASSGLPSIELRAKEYLGGRLDWASVDTYRISDGVAGEPLTIRQRGVPAPARFGGMPATRFWEMEDARFDPGAVDAAPIDLGRLMLVEYATVYGNDWFVVPMRVPVASLSQISQFTVHDVFGGTTILTAIDPDVDGWNLFSLTEGEQELAPGQERPTSPWFLLAPSLPGSLESSPVDSMLLLRDEMANVAWAVESVVADDQGRPRDRFAEWAGHDAPVPVPTDFASYHVDTVVPSHWFPLVPEQLADQESIRLRLAPLTRLVEGEQQVQSPAGTLLPSGDVWLHEEEVPRAGVQVVRTWQYARWHDGSRHLWRARHKLTGGGEGSSGLSFDQVQWP